MTRSCANHMIITRAAGCHAQPFRFTEHELVCDYTHKRCTEKRCNLSWNTKHQINQLTNCHMYAVKISIQWIGLRQIPFTSPHNSAVIYVTTFTTLAHVHRPVTAPVICWPRAALIEMFTVSSVFIVRYALPYCTGCAKKVNPKCSIHNFVKYWPILKILSLL